MIDNWFTIQIITRKTHYTNVERIAYDYETGNLVHGNPFVLYYLQKAKPK